MGQRDTLKIVLAKNVYNSVVKHMNYPEMPQWVYPRVDLREVRLETLKDIGFDTGRVRGVEQQQLALSAGGNSNPKIPANKYMTGVALTALYQVQSLG
jgi:hypothetical protein